MVIVAQFKVPVATSKVWSPLLLLPGNVYVTAPVTFRIQLPPNTTELRAMLPGAKVKAPIVLAGVRLSVTALPLRILTVPAPGVAPG
jgi:hypothetical protein